MMAAQGQPVASGEPSYQDKMCGLVADQDPFDVLARTPSLLAGIVGRHSTSVLRSRPFEGKWTPNEIIGHLTDSEWVYGYRLRLILCEANPTLLGTQQDSWVIGLGHNHREPLEHVEIFRTLRRLNLEVWRRSSPSDLERTGRHNERGTESLSTMLRLLAGHDLSHLNQINRYIEAIR